MYIGLRMEIPHMKSFSSLIVTCCTKHTKFIDTSYPFCTKGDIW